MTPKKKKRIEKEEENAYGIVGLENLGIFSDDQEYDEKEYWRDYC